MLPRGEFSLRVLRHAGAAALVILASLGIGVLGYHVMEGLSWLDPLLNASMILGGMGPVNTLSAPAAKVFASVYALFAGIVFLVTAGLFIGPVAHRMLHWLHLEEAEGSGKD